MLPIEQSADDVPQQAPHQIPVRSLTVTLPPLHPQPHDSHPSTIVPSPTEREFLDKAVRVDQAGELAMNYIYVGQAFVLGRDPQVKNIVKVCSGCSFASERILNQLSLAHTLYATFPSLSPSSNARSCPWFSHPTDHTHIFAPLANEGPRNLPP